MTPVFKNHAHRAKQFNKDEARVDWHDETLWWIRQKRDKAAYAMPDWEALREAASQIKNNVLSNLQQYLLQFEAAAQRNGIIVHWAANAQEHNDIVHTILKSNTISAISKSKSMLTEECGLNNYLKSKGVDVIDTDLGERIVQLAEEHPSHIVLPCIHKKKEEIGVLFNTHLGTPAGESDPNILTAAAREHLRQTFLSRTGVVTGANFGIAETGEFVICTNEGNADMGAHLSDVHIACMGIEKIVPERKHLAVFLRLLARSATGQPITTYSSHFARPRKGQQMHLVLVDNGRSQLLAKPEFRASLKCIRCGACMNTCPVYRKSGGHSYHTIIAGPIGAILAPNLDMKRNADLPFASTLCGSCTHVCPVKIDIHDQLYKWRQVLVQDGFVAPSKMAGMKMMQVLLSSSTIFNYGAKATRWFMKRLPLFFSNRFNPWYKGREMPRSPKQTFGEWYAKNKK